jgi:predicted permease
MRNVAHALRGLAKAPGFTVTILLTLAVGIGATVAVFGVLNSVLLKPLPYPDADELVAVWHVAPGAPGVTDASGGLRPSPSMYFTYAEEGRALQSVGLWQESSATITGLAEPEQVAAVIVTAGVLETLRVPPILGRWLTAEDQVPGAPNRTLVGYDYWQTRLGGDRNVIGRTLTVNGRPAEVVGVMPAGFRVVTANAELIVPARFDRSRQEGPPFCCRMIGRLAPGATIADGNADIERMLPIWLETFAGGAAAFFRDTWQIAPALRPLKQDVVGGVGNVLWVVLGTVGVVLLIACANALNLLLVRAESREREFAVRAALGAGAWRIARVLMLESLALGALGGALGLLVAEGTLRLLMALGPRLPRLDEIALDARAIALTFAVSLLAGALLGAIPALKLAGRRVVAGLHGSARGSSGGRRQFRVQSALVVAQVALALVLLVSSGLMIRTFQSLLAVEPGFSDPATLQTVRLSIPAAVEPDPARVLRMQNDIVDAFAAIPGVESAAFVSEMPLENRDADWDGVYAEGQTVSDDEGELAVRRFKYISPGLLQTAGMRLVAGRDIEWPEVYADRRVALISENLARELFGSAEAALGRRIRPGRGEQFRDVVGVVQDVRDNAVDQAAPAIAYWPSFMNEFYFFQPQTLQRSVTFVVRSPLAGTEGLLRQMERAVWSVNPALPLAAVQTMQEIYDASLARQSFTLVMLATAGGVALLLGVVGLYGVLSYVVGQRRREIAIRLALGAQPREVTRRFVGQGVALTGVGVVVGLVAAVGVTRLMESLLFGVQPLDLATYASAALVLPSIAAFASWLPARRASAVDPAEALAAE